MVLIRLTAAEPDRIHRYKQCQGLIHRIKHQCRQAPILRHTIPAQNRRHPAAPAAWAAGLILAPRPALPASLLVRKLLASTMAASLSARTALGGVQLQQKARAGHARLNTQIVAAVKKVNSYDDNWSKGKAAGDNRGLLPPPLPPAAKPVLASACSADLRSACPAGIGSVGIFLEDREKPSVNIFKQVGARETLGEHVLLGGRRPGCRLRSLPAKRRHCPTGTSDNPITQICRSDKHVQ